MGEPDDEEWTFEDWVTHTGGCPCDQWWYSVGDCPEHDRQTRREAAKEQADD